MKKKWKSLQDEEETSDEDCIDCDEACCSLKGCECHYQCSNLHQHAQLSSSVRPEARYVNPCSANYPVCPRDMWPPCPIWPPGCTLSTSCAVLSAATVSTHSLGHQHTSVLHSLHSHWHRHTERYLHQAVSGRCISMCTYSVSVIIIWYTANMSRL